MLIKQIVKLYGTADINMIDVSICTDGAKKLTETRARFLIQSRV